MFFLTPEKSVHGSNTEPEMSKSSLLLSNADDIENEKENDSNAAKQLLEEETGKDDGNGSESGHRTEGHFRSNGLDFRSVAADISIDLTSDDEVPTNAKVQSASQKERRIFCQRVGE